MANGAVGDEAEGDDVGDRNGDGTVGDGNRDGTVGNHVGVGHGNNGTN